MMDGTRTSAAIAHSGMMNPHERVAEIATEQRRRWSDGDFVPLESLLDAGDPIWADSELLTDLAVNEYQLHLEHGVTLDRERFLQRFPVIEKELRRYFGWADAISAGFDVASAEHDADSIARLVPMFLNEESLTGERVGPFDVEELIGRGGFGDVYRGRHSVLGHEVALKFTSPEQFGNAEQRRRAVCEARIAAQLRHDHIVRSLDVIERAHMIVLVYDYVPGKTLADWMEANQPADPVTAVRILTPIAEAVHHAHTAGICHRDIKPANILLDERHSYDGLPFRPMLTDFGLARPVPRRDAAESDSILIVGSPCYMPPEQARGERPTSPAGDVYSLGAVLYEMLTGKPVFEGTMSEVLLRLKDDSPPPRIRNPDVPPELGILCSRCLSYEPANRIATAKELAGCFRACLSDLRTPRLQLRMTPRKWFLQNLGAILLSTGILLAALFAGLAAASFPADNSESAAAVIPVPSDIDPQRKLIRVGTARIFDVPVSGIFFAGNGQWYAASSSATVYRFNGFQQRTTVLKTGGHGTISDIAVDRRGNLLAGAPPPGRDQEADLYRFDANGKRLRIVVPSHHPVVGLDIDSQEHVWMAFRDGRVECRTHNGEVVRQLKRRFPDIAGISINGEARHLLIQQSTPQPATDRLIRVSLEDDSEQSLLNGDEIELWASGVDHHGPSKTIYVANNKSGHRSRLIVFAENPMLSQLQSVDDQKLGNPQRYGQPQWISYAGNSAVTRDTRTGLEWLDLRYTINMSVAQVEAELRPGGRFAGFRYANMEEVNALYATAGLPSSDLRRDHFARLADLQKLLGIGELTTSEVWDVTAIAADRGVRDSDRQATRHICNFEKKRGTIDTAANRRRNAADSQTAHWLVREQPGDARIDDKDKGESSKIGSFKQSSLMIASIGSLLAGVLGWFIVTISGRRKQRP